MFGRPIVCKQVLSPLAFLFMCAFVLVRSCDATSFFIRNLQPFTLSWSRAPQTILSKMPWTRRRLDNTLTPMYKNLQIVILGVEDEKILRGMTSPKYFSLGFWVITRHHGGVKVPGLEDIFPTGLPELFQPSRTPKSNENLFLVEIKHISVPEIFFN